MPTPEQLKEFEKSQKGDAKGKKGMRPGQTIADPDLGELRKAVAAARAAQKP